ncbi:MAG: DUF1538 domain-containing protein [Zetaproteobacteria bacterium CG12_big_fil_rev_8_21_14_0_65_55_1124]|nr:MAG: hypothetical protein AUJ58_06365 [Zetaproteobacteria bacterium CG1_02_55_237]PIS20397.1 MAG: DUF1538 domain-containing protein [Zetaproteobacteria bacterium CG08_land_8_20_14_0_20_55_17]PIW42593.1 MAG: DUF1538 domain-containing protein [Zetaproteobacteria bacterium CG12_big_fil_rev_8_21_14_0_65_55_1124]PIY54198.1 MAG: DUF1538 domain-containing protein [Zetaproteobacteria bacterium CG_4_10_14_0_8_um_filter_55_43]PIZ38372.1 MAG: DUF1538 domain-containing protein [Zetaproteobacteria bacter
MFRPIRFGDYVHEIASNQHQISYNELASRKVSGRRSRRRVRLRPLDVYRLLTPYISVRFFDQLKTVLPLAIYLALFQILILRTHIAEAGAITAGLTAVIIGLMLFMEGLKLGLMPFGETIGSVLPAKSPLPVVLLVALLLGIGVTFAEPAIGALKTAGSIVDPEKAPYLHAMLNGWSEVLVLVVGLGVGFAAVLGTLRFLNGWSLKPLIYATLVPILGLTAYFMTDPNLSQVLGLAWDCGAVTTGPVTVPLVLALGIGIAGAAGRGNSSLSGFGIVTLASLFPILGVLLLALYITATVTPDQLLATASLVSAATDVPWYESTPGQEVILGMRAILPLVAFLFLVMRYLLREKIQHPAILTYGIVLCVLGMIVFNLGLSYGLSALGGQSGGLVPAAFLQIDTVSLSPLYDYGVGIAIAVAFAWFLGFGATMAEPALNALGLTVESLTNGAFRKSMLMMAVSIGVGCGIALGLAKVVFDLPLAALLIPGYLAAAVLTFFSSEEFVNIAWDSAGVTTGPVTVPLVLALGLGLGGAIGAVDGFGILSMASIGPILSVLTTGLWVQWQIKRRHAAAEEAMEVA